LELPYYITLVCYRASRVVASWSRELMTERLAIFAAPPWFGTRRALGMGVVLLGASIGSIITPILVEHVLLDLGFPWAVRIMAFVYLFFCVSISSS
jgi:hypothetical protein